MESNEIIQLVIATIGEGMSLKLKLGLVSCVKKKMRSFFDDCAATGSSSLLFLVKVNMVLGIVGIVLGIVFTYGSLYYC